MTAKALPPHANLRHLRLEAKSQLKAHRDGDTTVCATLRDIPRLAGKSDEEILRTPVQLQEVQASAGTEVWLHWLDSNQKAAGQVANHRHPSSKISFASMASRGSAPTTMPAAYTECRRAFCRRWGRHYAQLAAECMKDLDSSWSLAVGPDRFDGSTCAMRQQQLARLEAAREHDQQGNNGD